MEDTLVTVLRTTNYSVYPLSIPKDGTYPCIVYQKVSRVNRKSHQGNIDKKARFQIACWGKTYDDALTVAQAVETALDLNQIDFELATFENELDDKEVETNLYRKILEFYILE